MEGTIWSLVPPLLAIAMVLLTKRVLISLGTGIIAAALFVDSFNILGALRLIWNAFSGVFYADGAVNTWNVYILLFVLMLGIITAFMSMMGGTKAFAEWMIIRVKTRAGAQIMTLILGIIVFVDDYFNSLAVGQIAKPVTDKHRVSRAKLAYIVDSTAAPVCVVAPISSWGAYIVGIIGTIFVTQSITEYTALGAFMQMIPMNFYVWSALGMVFIIAVSRADFGPMKIHEQHAIKTGEVFRTEMKEGAGASPELSSSDAGRVSDLLIPIATLFIATIGAIYFSGLGLVEGKKTLMNIFGSADVSIALFWGGLIGIAVTFLLFIRHYQGKNLSAKDFFSGIRQGTKSMLPGFMILIFAWVIAALIDSLGTGTYLAGLVQSSNLGLMILPFIVFVIAGFISFATGTSWGSFGILLPIAGEIAVAADVTLLLPMMAAVLAGAVFGDHCSPISDTTILSSTGSSCNHIDHVTTQLPYAFVAAGIAGIGYLVLGITGNVWIGLVTVIIGLIIIFSLLRRTGNRMETIDN